MSDNQDNLSAFPVMKKRRTWKRFIGWVLLLLLLLAVPFYHFGTAKGTMNPWTWNREKPERTKNSAIGANAGVFLTSVSFSRSSSHTHPSNACVDFREIVVRPGSNHPLEIACAEQIAEKLKEIPEIQRVVFTGSEPLIDKSKPLPLWIIQVNLAQKSEGYTFNRNLNATLGVSFGRTLMQSPRIFSGSDDAPLIQYESNATIQIKCSHTGLATQTYFYQKVGEEIAKKLVESVQTVIDTESRKYSQLPDLPDSFYPEYIAALASSDIPGVVSRTILYDGRRLMMPHYSVEKLEIDAEKPNNIWLSELQTQMNEQGWNGSLSGSSDANLYLRLTKGDETYYLFQEAKNEFVTPLDTILAQEKQEKERETKAAPKARIFFLGRSVKMNRDALLDAIATLVDEKASPQTLLLFTPSLHGNEPIVLELRQKIYDAIKDTKPETAMELLSRARFFIQVGEKEKAKNALFRAWRVRDLMLQKESNTTYEYLAKELDVLDEMKSLEPPTPELCEEVGFIYVTPDMCPYDITTEPNRHVKIAVTSSEGKLGICIVKIQPQGTKLLRSFYQLTPHEHGSSSSNMKTQDEVSLRFPSWDSKLNKAESYSIGLLPGQTPYHGGPIKLRIQCSN